MPSNCAVANTFPPGRTVSIYVIRRLVSYGALGNPFITFVANGSIFLHHNVGIRIISLCCCKLHKTFAREWLIRHTCAIDIQCILSTMEFTVLLLEIKTKQNHIVQAEVPEGLL